ncbi:MAG TPA: hypothetical protein PLM14_02785 [Candidatus Hydrogenedentes bacterium]|nr:hypothetical protein [Candidatus Hydrogenedentota bacterium]HQH52305.1 hypothetical protein [Candidatus Hydrogenedentota bacterium]
MLRFTAILVMASAAYAGAAPSDARVDALKTEVAGKGWIVYGARSDNGTWDLFLSRPDGTGRRNITNTPDFEEAAPRFSPDGSRLLYRRLEKGTTIDHDRWGFQGCLVIANADGSNPQVGKEGAATWASWSPDGKQVACLDKKGIYVLDCESREAVRGPIKRQGIYQQLFWSPDGKWFCGVANIGGESWTVVRMNAETGEMNAVRKFQNCTPDWFPDSQRIILSSRPAGQKVNEGYGYTQLWAVDGAGGNDQLLYGEEGFHIYGGAVSPDGAYVLFSTSPKDGSGAENAGGQIYIMRLADAPTIAGESAELRQLHPATKDGPVLFLAQGWEPHWTCAEIGVKQ